MHLSEQLCILEIQFIKSSRYMLYSLNHPLTQTQAQSNTSVGIV